MNFLISKEYQLALRARRKAWCAGPRRDIVGAYSKIKTPHQNSNKRFLEFSKNGSQTSFAPDIRRLLEPNI